MDPREWPFDVAIQVVNVKSIKTDARLLPPRLVLCAFGIAELCTGV